jgi:hypothetical protein
MAYGGGDSNGLNISHVYSHGGRQLSVREEPFMRASFATVGLVAATSALASPFQMPSGNIRCTSDVHNGQPSDIVCTILERSGPPTTPPPPECQIEWGYTFELGGRGDVKAACGGPITLDGGVPVLRYGRTWTLGGVICVSSESGLECRNADGHGFFLSRARQSVF